MRFDENNLILGIDPGQHTHGLIVLNSFLNIPVYSNPEATTKEIYEINGRFESVIIEDYDSVHGNVGHSVLETVRNIGRMQLHFQRAGYFVHLIGRSEIKKKIKCNNDSDVRKFLKEKYGNNVIKEIKSHCLPALAAIYTYKSI